MIDIQGTARLASVNHGAGSGVVLLDRDGTIIEDREYLADPEGVRLLPGVAEGLTRLQAAGFRLVVVTNQSGIGRGLVSQEQVAAVHARMCADLERSGIRLAGVYHCPHAPDARCGCRKPATGLVDRAATELGFRPEETIVVGDKESDLGLAEALGVPGVLVLTGAGRAALEASPTLPGYVAVDLVEAAAIITSLRPERSEGITHLTTAPSSARGLLDPQSEPDNLQPMPPSDDHLTAIHDYLHQSAGVLRATADACAEDIAKAVDLLVECYRGGGKVLLCGNGGSAADCQHMAAELMNVLSRDRHRPPLAAVALTTDTSLLTAIANDFGYERVFERQVEALGRPGDVLIGISTSGNSPNVIRALTRARTQGCRTVLMTGASGGAALAHADVAILVPAADPQQVQQAHSSIGHLVCGRVERELYG